MKKFKILLSIFFVLTALTQARALPNEIIGSRQCLDCHGEMEETWPENPHRKAESKWGRSKLRGCEACHEAGGKHQESYDPADIINPTNLDAEGQNKFCGSCHFAKGRELKADLWSEGAHAQSGLSCLDCHDVHQVGNAKLLNEESVLAMCFTCHDDKEEGFLQSRHGANAVVCSDCHDPHGSEAEFLLRGDGRQSCQSCHDKQPHHFIADKRKAELTKLACTSCHQGHYEAGDFLKYKKEELCGYCHKEIY